MAGGESANLCGFFCFVWALGLIQKPGCSSTSLHVAFIASPGRHPVSITKRIRFADVRADLAFRGLKRLIEPYSFSASEMAAISPSLKNLSRPSSRLRATPLHGLPRPAGRHGLA